MLLYLHYDIAIANKGFGRPQALQVCKASGLQLVRLALSELFLTCLQLFFT